MSIPVDRMFLYERSKIVQCLLSADFSIQNKFYRVFADRFVLLG